MKVLSKSALDKSKLMANEVIIDASGEITSPNGYEYPEHIRNGYFNSDMNTWSNPMAPGSNHVFDGWHIKRNGTLTINAALGSSSENEGFSAPKKAVITIVESSLAENDYCILEQRTYNAAQFSDSVITVDFEAKSSDEREIGVEFVLDTGTASYIVRAGTHSIKTEAQKFTAQACMPDIIGESLVGLHNMKVRFWIAGGSNFSTRFGSSISQLGGTFSISAIRDRSKRFKPSKREEVLQVAKYYHKSSTAQLMQAVGTTAHVNNAVCTVNFPTAMDYTPGASDITLTGSFVNNPSPINISDYKFDALGTSLDAASSARITGYTVNIELPE